ncbi:MAG: 4-amino-4-deoxy-L-arabinose transferase related glycosyltransferases of PMT family, partial [halophilic archaeon J07HX5]
MARQPAPAQSTTARDRLSARLSLNHVFLAVLIILWGWFYLRGLGDLPVRVWDETRYAMPAQLMTDGGSWLTPHIRVPTHSTDLGLQRRIVKPPLVYWLQALLMSVFGVSEFAARLPTALATLGCAVLVYHIGRHVYDRRAGLSGALLLIVFPGLLLGSHGGRAAVSDTTLMLFGSLFVWFTWRGRKRPRLLVPAGVLAGLAVMTKGVAAGVFVIVLLPVVLASLRN